MDIRIGITTSFQNGEQRLDHAYVQAVERAGALPVIMPMVEDISNVRHLAQLIDGLVITGGPAITDGMIGDLPEDLPIPDPVRTQADAALLKAFIEAKRPILGICYGMQLLNAVHGGAIYADVERDVDGAGAHSDKRGAPSHRIDLHEATHLRKLLKAPSLFVNTRHVQAVAEIAKPFRLAARAFDGTVEAIETADGTMIGVQFHPENMGADMMPLFRHLVVRARHTGR